MTLPRTLHNADLGVDLTFLVTMDESDDGRVESEVTIAAGEPGPPLHRHVDFEETFSVVDGELSMDLGERRGLVLRAGEAVTVPVDIPHRYYNAGDRPATFRFRAAPGAAYEKSFRALAGLAAAGRTTRTGLPRNPLESALVFQMSGSYVAGVPIALQRVLSDVGAWIARRVGADRRLAALVGAERL
jgi:mannose-6-phosphate isomerase-like protein (cupin superfamily)